MPGAVNRYRLTDLDQNCRPLSCLLPRVLISDFAVLFPAAVVGPAPQDTNQSALGQFFYLRNCWTAGGQSMGSSGNLIKLRIDGHI